MGWLRLRIEVPEAQVAAAEVMLESVGALSVTVTDAGNAPILEPDPGTTPVWGLSCIEALFDPGADIQAIRVGLGQSSAVAVDFLEDQDWQAAYREQALEVCFADRLWIVPRDAVPPSRPALRLEPGLAFGSGSHPTTRLCLEWLARAPLEGMRVLDYGCGSGILALAALELGAIQAVAIDHDAQALLATRDNAAYNGLADGRLTVAAPDELGNAGFDLVVANILANPLIELAALLTAATLPRGTLVLSGILADQSDAVMKAYPDVKFEPPTIEIDDQGAGWARLVGSRQERPGQG